MLTFWLWWHKIIEDGCAGFGWINILHMSWYGLCYGIANRDILYRDILAIAKQCWQQSQGLFCFSPHSTGGETGGSQEVGKEHRWEGWPNWPTETFHTINLCAQQSNCGKWVMFRAMGVCLSRCYPPPLEIAEHLLSHGNQWTNSLFCFASHAQLLLCLINCLYLNSRVFSLLLFWLSSHHPTELERTSSPMGLSWWSLVNYDKEWDSHYKGSIQPKGEDRI